ncbi:arsenite efflux MFS transporter ArsK [Rhizobium sp. YIM 134829]|uniref:arsenite efflux MFS transporter ArsK n=1 Tax=Rhizobium sp. YIM 134829 TaxID=3390453 RepID=UPI0039796940
MRASSVSAAAPISALGLTQIVGYGTLYYSFPILAPSIAADLGLRLDLVFGIYSLSLLAGGLCAPVIGRRLDRHGAASVMAVGSLLSALLFVLSAWSPSLAIFVLAIVLQQIAAGMVQYQAAFAALVQLDAQRAPRTITALTLIAGFASSLFWPISAGLSGWLSWRDIHLVFAALHLALCLPLHLWLRGRGPLERPSGSAPNGAAVIGVLAPAARRRGMVLVGLGFAVVGFTLTAFLAHLVPLLQSMDHGAAAVGIAALFGPAQVLSRVLTIVIGPRLSPPGLAALSGLLIVLGVLILAGGGAYPIGAVASTLCLGLGSGINSIAQGSLPLHLFGSQAYGLVTGKLAAARLAFGAAAPFLFAFLLQALGSGPALLLSAGLGALGFLAFLAVFTTARQPVSLKIPDLEVARADERVTQREVTPL